MAQPECSLLFGISSAKLLHFFLIDSEVLLARTECSQILCQDVNINIFYQLGLHCSLISGILEFQTPTRMAC